MPSSKNLSFNIGLLTGITANIIWGIQSIFWKRLSEVGGAESLAHRYLWTLIFIFSFIVFTKRLAAFRLFLSHLRNPRIFSLLLLSAVLCSVNWLISIYAPMAGKVIELSIGQLLVPLLNAALGAFIFKEPISKLKIVSLSISSLGILFLLFNCDSFPWIALGFSLSWSLYTAAKHWLKIDPYFSVVTESALIFPFVAYFFLNLYFSGHSHFSLNSDPKTTYLLICTGLVTSVPMILYASATNSLPMNILGVCQYLTPILSFLLGITVFSENLTLEQFIPILLIWIAILIFVFAEQKDRKLNCTK